MKAIEKVCVICGKTFYLKDKRKSGLYCSRHCSGIAKKAEPNTVCANCGKEFHLKPRRKKQNKTNKFFCCQKCMGEYRSKYLVGENHPNYGKGGANHPLWGGEETERQSSVGKNIMVYKPEHPFAHKDGRIPKYRLLVEQNYNLYDEKYFVIINGNHYLPPNIAVHHKDFNHENNSIENLEPLTTSEHASVHRKAQSSIYDERGNIVASFYNLPKHIKILRTSPDNVLPKRAHRFDAAFDMYTQSEVCIPNGRSIIPMGFKLQLPLNCAAYVKGRSGNDSKGILGIDGKRHNADIILGLIDPQFIGEVGLIINNHENETFTIAKGDRIGQLLFFEIPEIEFVEVEEFEQTERSENGFGSSGLK